MKEIKLTQGMVALVDDEDFEYLNQFKWCAHKEGKGRFLYAVSTISLPNGDKRQVKMHRLIMGNPTKLMVDHINHDGLDNRKLNLRICTQQENQMNRSTIRGISTYKGVSPHKIKNRDKTYFYWRAAITLDNQKKELGNYKTEEEAALAYNKKAKELFGEFAYLNEVKNEVNMLG